MKDDDKDRYRPKKKLVVKGYYKGKANLARIEYLKNLTRSAQTPRSRLIVDLLLDLADKGVNLEVIHKATNEVQQKYYHRTGLFNMTMDLPHKGETMDRIHAIRKAAKTIADLKPVFQGYAITKGTNDKLNGIQVMLKQILDEYCAFSLYQDYIDPLTEILFPGNKTKTQDTKEMELQVICDSFKHDGFMKILSGFEERTSKRKNAYSVKGTRKDRRKTTDHSAAVRSMHGIWGEAVKKIVDEIKRAGCESLTECYKITAKILHTHFPDIYPDEWKPVKATYLYTSSKKV